MDNQTTGVDLDKLEALASNRLNGGLCLTREEALALIDLARRAEPSVAAVASGPEEALGHIQGLVDFAYAQGFHELGYDPVAVVRAALASPAVSQKAAPVAPDGYKLMPVTPTDAMIAAAKAEYQDANATWFTIYLAILDAAPAAQQAVSQMDELLDALEHAIGGWSGDPADKVQAIIDQHRVIPDCGACPGNGSICKTECRHRAENPPGAVSQMDGVAVDWKANAECLLEEVKRYREIFKAAAMGEATTASARCVICCADEPRTGTCGSDDPRALCNQATTASVVGDSKSEFLAHLQRASDLVETWPKWKQGMFASETNSAQAPSRDADAPLPAPVARNFETDAAHRLRLHATNANLSQDLHDALITGANECDRFYRGMMAWKRTAEEKDASHAANAGEDAARLDFMAERGAWIAWTKDGESCRVFVRNEDGDTGPLMGWIPEAWAHSAREAIDKARAAIASSAAQEGK
jgi:hypothetical protein